MIRRRRVAHMAGSVPLDWYKLAETRQVKAPDVIRQGLHLLIATQLDHYWNILNRIYSTNSFVLKKISFFRPDEIYILF